MDKIVCLGKNYRDHMKELGDAPVEKPVIFLKPPSCAKFVEKWNSKTKINLPLGKGETHYECEVVYRVGVDGKSIDAVTLGLDLTMRELQTQCKKNGHPWTTAKVFPSAAIVGPMISISNAHQAKLFESAFTFSLAQEIKQRAFVKDMMMSIEEALPYISFYFDLCPGDLIFTGTPAGVGPLHKNDVSEIKWNDYSYQIEWN